MKTGSLVLAKEDIQEVIVDYFANLFTTSSPCNFDVVLDTMATVVTEDMNMVFCTPYTKIEVLETLKMMHPNKAPRLNGFNLLFFQR